LKPVLDHHHCFGKSNFEVSTGASNLSWGVRASAGAAVFAGKMPDTFTTRGAHLRPEKVLDTGPIRPWGFRLSVSRFIPKEEAMIDRPDDVDITSPEFRVLPPSERIKRLQKVEDALYEECHAKPRDPEIDKIAAKRKRNS
jgi:hypothetical protein